MSPYHLQHNHRATNVKRPQTNYEGEVLSSSNPDPVETMGAEEARPTNDTRPAQAQVDARLPKPTRPPKDTRRNLLDLRRLSLATVLR